MTLMPLHSAPLQSSVKALAKMLIGTFDNTQQAAEDRDFILVKYDNCAVTLRHSPFAGMRSLFLPSKRPPLPPKALRGDA